MKNKIVKNSPELYNKVVARCYHRVGSCRSQDYGLSKLYSWYLNKKPFSHVFNKIKDRHKNLI